MDVFSDNVTKPSNKIKYHIALLKSNVHPIAEPPRRIRLYDKLKKTLDNYESQNIISKVNTPTE